MVQGLNRQVNGEKVPVITFTKGGGPWLEQIARCGADAVGLDWTVDLAAARQRVNDQVAFQGNMDPMALLLVSLPFEPKPDAYWMPSGQSAAVAMCLTWGMVFLSSRHPKRSLL